MTLEESMKIKEIIEVMKSGKIRLAYNELRKMIGMKEVTEYLEGESNG